MMKFKQWDCDIKYSHYMENKQIAILLKDSNDGSPVATASVCLPDYNFKKNETAIKDYSENEGMVKCLVDAGIIELTGETVRSGWVDVPIATVLEWT